MGDLLETNNEPLIVLKNDNIAAKRLQTVTITANPTRFPFTLSPCFRYFVAQKSTIIPGTGEIGIDRR